MVKSANLQLHLPVFYIPHSLIGLVFLKKKQKHFIKLLENDVKKNETLRKLFESPALLASLAGI